uniref:Methyltransferase type 11 domain-containing protein n=1 Tax=Solibacter usitatus (strain Ellin6076) TaxID=234267 RepID=Q01XP3_SOLUE
MSDSPWRESITAEDYERHMAATGQPQANAELLAEVFRENPPARGASVWFAGAGTGQIFDDFPLGLLKPYRVTCTDINPTFLRRLAERFPCETAVDDVECPLVRGPFELAIVILVLEHVDWRRTVEGLCGIARRVFVVIQQNPEGLVARAPGGTMSLVRGQLLRADELIAEFERHRFRMLRRSVRAVRDGKSMVGMEFWRTREAA